MARGVALRSRGKSKTNKNAGNGGDGRDLHVKDNGKASLSADEQRALFLHHRDAWNNFLAKRREVEEIGRDVKAALKADGFLLIHMQIADDLAASPKREQKVRMAVQERLNVARWMAHPLGIQMDMFESVTVDQTALERAFEDGKRAGMEGGKCENPHHFSAPDVEQSWIKGWHAGQSVKVITGIKSTEPTDSPAEERWASDEL